MICSWLHLLKSWSLLETRGDSHVKRKVSRQLVESAEEMKRLALGALRSIQKLPELVKSFFRQPECRYILE